MVTIRRSAGFIPVDKMPQVPETMSLRDVCSLLAQRGTGGFILLRSGRPEQYIDARDFGNGALAMAKNVGWKGWEKETLLDLIQSPSTNLNPLVIMDEPLLVDEDVIRVSGEYEGVYPVRDQARQSGWFFTDKSIGQEVLTSPLKFVCARGHKNSDPDEGYCYKCPAKIVKVE